jgi:hypothetical protein
VEDRNRISELVSALRKVEKEVADRNLSVARQPEALPLIPTIPPLSPLPSVRTRSLDDPVTPPNKRFKPSGHQVVDVLYGPVDSDGSPRAIAKAAMDLIHGLHPSDVLSARYAQGQPGVISIRFGDSQKADRFLSAIDERPLLQGQTATLAGERDSVSSGYGARQSPVPSPLDIIRGAGKSSRRR